MIPNVFVSSTIQDLHHLRDAIRDVVTELGYTPFMSEYGDLGYLPDTTAEKSCYRMMEQCQLAIIVIGKRYGSPGSAGVSVTHNEFRTARERGIPVICLIDHEVLAFKRLYDVAAGREPFVKLGMDAPDDTFNFIRDVTSSPVNNSVLGFATVADARFHLKRQLAHLFGELLRTRFDSTRAEIKDILSELKTLRHDLKSIGTKEHPGFLKAVRFLVDDSTSGTAYRRLLAVLSRPVDAAVPQLISAQSFDTVVEQFTGKGVATFQPNYKNFDETKQLLQSRGITKWHQISVEIDAEARKQMSVIFALTPEGELMINESGLEFFRDLHQQFLRFVSGEPSDGAA
jgi:Domain of unknown function (DUF4062)